MSTEENNGMDSGGENDGESFYTRPASSHPSWQGGYLGQGGFLSLSWLPSRRIKWRVIGDQWSVTVISVDVTQSIHSRLDLIPTVVCDVLPQHGGVWCVIAARWCVMCYRSTVMCHSSSGLTTQIHKWLLFGRYWSVKYWGNHLWKNKQNYFSWCLQGVLCNRQPSRQRETNPTWATTAPWRHQVWHHRRS